MSALGNLAAGSVLGRYELVLRVASGGMGEVWAARIKGSRGFQKVVALKTLLPELSHNPNFEQMFLDEAALAARIRHPNVVQVIDLGEESQVLFQVMEWVSGESLWGVMRAAAKRGGIPLEVAARIIYQVCAGLHAAHELKDETGEPIGLVHRDISPQNILLTTQGIAKVVDFGVAKFAGRGVAATQVGELRGKVPYMAPEHIRGQQLDRKADVFALGLLFYQLVSGEHPFLADNDQLTMARISSPLPALPLRKKVPSASEELSRIVSAALEKSPAKRTPTALELMHQIERVIPDAGQQSSNDYVAEFLKEVAGEPIEARDLELREALKRLDQRPSMPSIHREDLPQPAGPGAPLAEASAPPLVSPIAAGPDQVPMTPPLNTPSAVVSGTAQSSADEEDLKRQSAFGRATSGGRNRVVAGAAVVAVVAGVVIGVARAPGSTVTESRVSSAPSLVSAAVRVAAAALEPSFVAPQAAAVAAQPAAPSGSAPGTAGSSRASPVLPAGGSSVKAPQKGTKKPREFTPGGL